MKPAPQRWWTWPSVWGMDAILVALAWQLAFAQFYGVVLDPSSRWSLALTVFAIYVTDRLLDGLGEPPESMRTERHRIPALHPKLHLCLVITAVISALWLALTQLPILFTVVGVLIMLVCMWLLGGGNRHQTRVRWWRILTLWTCLLVMALLAFALPVPVHYIALGLLMLGWQGTTAIGLSLKKQPSVSKKNFSKGVIFSAGCMLTPVLAGSSHLGAAFSIYALPLVGFGALAAYSMEVVDQTESDHAGLTPIFLPCIALLCATLLFFLFPAAWGRQFAFGLGCAAIAVVITQKITTPDSRPVLTDTCLLLPGIFALMT